MFRIALRNCGAIILRVMEQSSSNQHQQKLADMVAHFNRHYPINRKPMTPWHKKRMQEGAREYRRFLKAMKKEGKTWA